MTTTEIHRRVPSLPSTPVIGAARELRQDCLGTVLRAAREIGDSPGCPPGWRVGFYSVATPDLVSAILSQPDRYTKSNQFYCEVRSALGNGMLTSENEVWHRQRRFLAPMFTARIIGRILFGADMTSALPKLVELRYVSDLILQRGFAPHPAPPWLPTRANRRMAAGLAGLRDIVDTIIAQRRGRPGSAQAPDLLGLLLHARDAENSQDRLSDEEVADQMLIFLLAGHDTTASTLACLLGGRHLALGGAPLAEEATFLQNYRLSTSVRTIPLRAAVTLRPGEALPVQLQPASPQRPSRSSRP